MSSVPLEQNVLLFELLKVKVAQSDSLGPHGPFSPWNTQGQNTGVGTHCLFQRIFSTQGSNPGLPHCRQMLYRLSHQGSTITEYCSFQSELATGTVTRKTISQRTSEKYINPL